MTLSATSQGDFAQSSAIPRTHGRFAFHVAVVGFVATLATFYPGFMSSDALDQFAQGMAGRYSDWHPPIMAALWSLYDRVWIGPQPMLLFQLVFYWLAAGFMVASLPAATTRLMRWCVVALLVSPVMLNFVGVIAKDAQLMAAWAFVAATCYFIRTRGDEPNVATKTALVVLLLYGALLRQNATLVAGPLALYVLIGRPFMGSIVKTLATYLAIALLCLGLSTLFNRLVHAEHTTVLRSLFMFDMAGVTVRTGENAFPFPVSESEMQRLDACYLGGRTHDKFVWGDCSFIHERSEAPGFDDGVIIRDWLGMIARHPAAYLAHRFAHFSIFSGLRTLQPAWAFWVDGSAPNELGFDTHRHPLFYAMKFYVYAAVATPLLRVGFWFMAAGFLLWLSCRRDVSPGARDFATMAAITSLLYLLTYLPFGVAPDFRYAYPAIMLTSFGFCALIEPLAELVRALAARFPRRRMQSA
jgi:hypothetical protein